MKGGRQRSSAPAYCKGCLEKQQAMNRQSEEIKRLKDRLLRQDRTAKEEPFGASTPSSKRLVRIGEGRCPRCGKTHRRRLPGVLPRSSCSNRLVAQAAAWHCFGGHRATGDA